MVLTLWCFPKIFAVVRVVIVPLASAKVKAFPALSSFGQQYGCVDAALVAVVAAGDLGIALQPLAERRLREYRDERRIPGHRCVDRYLAASSTLDVLIFRGSL
jgi:hypothetical protein